MIAAFVSPWMVAALLGWLWYRSDVENRSLRADVQRLLARAGDDLGFHLSRPRPSSPDTPGEPSVPATAFFRMKPPPPLTNEERRAQEQL